jgi:hypothetical protein
VKLVASAIWNPKNSPKRSIRWFLASVPATVLLAALLLAEAGPVAAVLPVDPVESIVLSPATATIIARTSQSYTVEAFDVDGASLGDYTPAVDFVIAGSEGRDACARNTCTPGYAGTFTITGTYRRSDTGGIVTGVATLHVNPGAPITPGPLSRLLITPQISTVAPGGSQSYIARGANDQADDFGDMTSAATFTISGGGSCTSNSCTSTVIGEHVITATSGSIQGVSLLEVKAAAATATPTVAPSAKPTVPSTGQPGATRPAAHTASTRAAAAASTAAGTGGGAATLAPTSTTTATSDGSTENLPATSSATPTAAPNEAASGSTGSGGGSNGILLIAMGLLSCACVALVILWYRSGVPQ